MDFNNENPLGVLDTPSKLPEAQESSPLDSVLGEPNETARITLSHEDSLKKKPDQAARLLKLEMQTGFPSSFIEEDIEGIEAEVAKSNFSPESFRKSNPKFASWMAKNPNHFALAKNDLPMFSSLEKTIEAIKGGWQDPNDMSEMAQILWKEMDDTIQPHEKSRLLELKNAQKDRAFSASSYGKGDYFAKQTAYGTSQMLDSIGVGLKGAGVGALTGAGVGVVGLAPGVVAGATGGAAIGALTAGALHAYNLETPLAYDEIRNSPDLKGDPIDKDSAIAVAKVVGAVNAAIETGSDALLLKMLPGAGKFVSGMTKPTMNTMVKKALAVPTTRAALVGAAKKIVSGAAIEGTEEFFQTLTGKLGREGAQAISGQEFAPDDPMADLGEAVGTAQDAAVGTLLPFSITHGATHYIANAREAKKAEDRKNLVLALGDAVTNSETFQTLPEKGQELVKEMTANGPLEKVYIDMDTWNTFWQEKGVDPREMAAEVIGDDGAAYDSASQGSSDIIIPTERYARKIAPTEHNKFFADELRFNPNEMSAKEVTEYFQEQEKKLNEPQAPDEKEVEFEKSAKQVEDEIKHQLLQFFPPKVAEGYAKEAALKFRTRAKDLDMGHMPYDLYQAEGLKVEELRGQIDEKAYAQESAKAPVFYSKLHRTLEQKMPNSASPEQINGIIKEVKGEERKWSGIDEFLKGKEKVSKEELLTFLRGNQVQIEEVVKGGTGYAQRIDDALRAGNEQLANDLVEERDSQPEQSPVKFDRYTLPGGENYKEILFTLPLSKNQLSVEEFYDQRYPDDKGGYNSLKGDRKKSFDKAFAEMGQENKPDEFRSSHFDEPNVLAHVRINDRVDADGNKVLFIEEVQSDALQLVRKERGNVKNAVENNFNEIISNMKKAGILEVDCD